MDSMPVSMCASGAASSSELPPFLEQIDLETVCKLALTTRFGSSKCSSHPNIACTVRTPPEAGSFNVAFTLDFHDGEKWIVRFPIEDWNPLLELRMQSDIVSMRYIRTHTDVPIPEVHGFSASTANALGRPYLFLSYVEGIQLAKVWFDSSWLTDAKRARVLESIATIMSKLAGLKFPTLGRLVVCPHSGECQVAPYLPCISTESTSLAGIGPYQTVHAYLLDSISKEVLASPGKTALVVLGLLRLYAATLPDEQFDAGPFTLHHPDLGLQNVFVNDDGNVTGLIDWDNTAIGHIQIGAASYPNWLFADWYPMCYGWTDEDSKADEASDSETSAEDESSECSTSEEDAESTRSGPRDAGRATAENIAFEQGETRDEVKDRDMDTSSDRGVSEGGSVAMNDSEDLARRLVDHHKDSRVDDIINPRSVDAFLADNDDAEYVEDILRTDLALALAPQVANDLLLNPLALTDSWNSPHLSAVSPRAVDMFIADNDEAEEGEHILPEELADAPDPQISNELFVDQEEHAEGCEPPRLSEPMPAESSDELKCVEGDAKVAGIMHSGARVEPVCPGQSSKEPLNGEDKRLSLRQRMRQDSPATLAQFRREYLEIYTRIDPENAAATAQSHIMGAIEIAIQVPAARYGILTKLGEYVFGEEEAGSKGFLQFYFLAKAISTGTWMADLVGMERLGDGEMFK